MTKFKIGKTESGSLEVDLMRLVGTRMLVQANSGGGKSWLLRLIAERVSGHIQTVILDPEGEFASLREKVDLVLVGSGGELTADPRAAQLLARKLLELRASAVIDLYDLKLPERRRTASPPNSYARRPSISIREVLRMPSRTSEPLASLQAETRRQ